MPLGTRIIIAAFALVIAVSAAASDSKPHVLGLKAALVSLYDGPDLGTEKGELSKSDVTTPIEVEKTSGRAYLIRCGDKTGWVDRSELIVGGLPDANDCHGKGRGGSSRGVNDPCRE
jgi:hypothetical protein